MGSSTSNSRTRGDSPRKGRDGAAAAHRAGHNHIPVSRVLYLPADLVEDMRSYRARHTLTNTALVLRALNATWQHVDDLARAELEPLIAPGDLFAEALTRPAAPRRQVEITPTGAQLDVIDNLTTTTQARDRSHLVALAVRAFLDENLS